MKKAVEDFVSHCKDCSVCKQGKPSGQLNQVEHEYRPWSLVAVDLIGPMAESNGYQYAMTMVDHGGRMMEIIPMKRIRGADVAEAFERESLCRYHRPDHFS